ncbi:MAG: DUF2336 domain-containing protein [Rhodospirillales bacterium]|nr:DUF2336 domain-containing protein [Rhodospirillales bacterium]
MNGNLVSERISYEKSKELARHADVQVRLALASRTDIRPEILFFLANDASPEVRRAVAANAITPSQSDVLLARDTDAAVRTGLAGKIAAVAPGLTANEADKARRATYKALELLAQDEMTRVRQLLAEILKDVADAPADIIRALAHDTEIEVSGPILEHSRVLTDEDLVEIIKSGPASGGLNAISRREALSETVSDAIVDTKDVGAIADLLGNTSAQIREETLDNLISQAPTVGMWHAPLVARPRLTNGAATRMAQFLADNLLDVLQKRSDINSETLAAVKTVVRSRLGKDSKAQTPDVSGPVAEPVQNFLKADLPLDFIRKMKDSGRLDQTVIAKALNAGDHVFVLAALCVLADIDPKVGRCIFAEKSPKGVVSLAWKASLPAKFSVLLQRRMARIGPTEVLMPREDDEHALDEPDMIWQLEFFKDLARRVTT